MSEFRAALQQFLERHVLNESLARSIMPAVLPRDDVAPEEITVLHASVARAAGRATDAAGVTGIYIMVQGVGRVDPIATWATITKPRPLLEADDVLSACDQIAGRLDTLILNSDSDAPQALDPESMHPAIWAAARLLLRDGHYRQAVLAAAEVLSAQVKARTGRNDVPDTGLWQEVFSASPPQAGKPRLRWPGNAASRDVKNMNEGLRQYAPGVQMTVRNPAAHGAADLTNHQALERLATLSLLARWLDNCELAEVDE